MKKILNNKYSKVIIITIMVLVVIIASAIISAKNHKLTCTISNTLHEGFDNTEEVVFKLKKGKIYEVKYNREIKISDFYKEYGVYTGVLESLFKTGYAYVKDAEINKDDSKVSIKYDTKESGVILNNVLINDTQEDKTSMAYNIASNLDNDEPSFKVGDEYSRKDLKKKIEDLKYTCK